MWPNQKFFSFFTQKLSTLLNHLRSIEQHVVDFYQKENQNNSNLSKLYQEGMSGARRYVENNDYYVRQMNKLLMIQKYKIAQDLNEENFKALSFQSELVNKLLKLVSEIEREKIVFFDKLEVMEESFSRQAMGVDASNQLSKVKLQRDLDSFKMQAQEINESIEQIKVVAVKI